MSAPHQTWHQVSPDVAGGADDDDPAHRATLASAAAPAPDRGRSAKDLSILPRFRRLNLNQKRLAISARAYYGLPSCWLHPMGSSKGGRTVAFSTRALALSCARHPRRTLAWWGVAG